MFCRRSGTQGFAYSTLPCCRPLCIGWIDNLFMNDYLANIPNLQMALINQNRLLFTLMNVLPLFILVKSLSLSLCFFHFQQFILEFKNFVCVFTSAWYLSTFLPRVYKNWFFPLICGEKRRYTNYLTYLACRNCQKFRWLHGGHRSFIILKSTPDSFGIIWINFCWFAVNENKWP